MLVIVDDKTDTVSLCGLSWSQLFFLDTIMIKASMECKNPTVRKAAEQIIEACEAAESTIIKLSDEQSQI